MKNRFPSPFRRRLLALAALSLSALGPASRAADVYWDIDGATPGAGGATPAGTWDTENTAYWSADPAGASAPLVWHDGDSAIFSAGTDADSNGGEDVFAHFSSIAASGFRSLTENQKVEFDVEQGQKGLQATNIRPL